MDIELLQLRASVIQKIRNFFIENKYLELDTPALSHDLIPETCLEIFKTDYIEPWSKNTKELYLVPSPEIYIKKIIAQHKVDVFQVSKCYRNVESVGRQHNPEFTMLEYYKMNANYLDSIIITENLFTALLPPISSDKADSFAYMRPPFDRLTMDEAFNRYAGFKLSDNQKASDLAAKARLLKIEEPTEHPFDRWAWDDLYELIFVQIVEQSLPADQPVLLIDYPVQSACLAKNKDAQWKERWELYCRGIEVANCYTEETDPSEIKSYFEQESALKNKNAKIPHTVDADYWKIFEKFPNCSGTALGVDRLLALVAGRSSIESVLPFPL